MFDEKSRNAGSVGNGVAIAFGLLIPGIATAALLGGVLNEGGFLIPVFLPGIVQLIWIIPAVLLYRKWQQTETAKGVVIGAAVILLLNASCFGLVQLAVR